MLCGLGALKRKNIGKNQNEGENYERRIESSYDNVNESYLPELHRLIYKREKVSKINHFLRKKRVYDILKKDGYGR